MLILLADVLKALREGCIDQAISQVRTWLVTAKPGEPEDLLAMCPDHSRAKLALLLGDLMSRYPATVLGAPVLMHMQPAESSMCPRSLPFPSTEQLQPNESMRFLGWLPLSTRCPLAIPFRPEHHAVTLAPRETQCAVALFRARPDVFDLEDLEVPNMWWARLFSHDTGKIRISSQMLLNYPAALEAGRVMLASARDGNAPPRTGFLSDELWGMAWNAGSLFQETTRRLADI